MRTFFPQTVCIMSAALPFTHGDVIPTNKHFYSHIIERISRQKSACLLADQGMFTMNSDRLNECLYKPFLRIIDPGKWAWCFTTKIPELSRCQSYQMLKDAKAYSLEILWEKIITNWIHKIAKQRILELNAEGFRGLCKISRHHLLDSIYQVSVI